jgi:hypothetical protein
MEWSDRPSPNRHLSHSLEKRDPSRHEGATGEKAGPFSVPLFDIKPFIAWQRRHGLAGKCKRDVQDLRLKKEPSMTKGGSK